MSSSRRQSQRRARRFKWAVAAIIVVVVAAGGWWVTRKGAVHVDSAMVRAQSAYEQGDLQAAVVDLKNVVRENPDNAAARYLLGRVYVDGGNPQGAIKELSRARDLGQSEPALNLALTRAMLMSGKFDDAATEIAIYGDTTQPAWAVLRGMLDLGQQRLDDARATFKRVLENAPDNVEARRGLMRAELAAGNADLAREEVERLLESSQDDIELWLIKGELDIHDGNREAARESFEKALALAPRNPLALLGVSRVLIDLGELDGASNYLDQIGDATSDPRVSFLRARISETRGDTASALQHLRQVLQLAPMHRQTLVMAAKLHFGRGEYTRAQDYVSRILEVDPQNAAARRMAGAIQLASGRMEGLDEVSNIVGDGTGAKDPGMLALLGTAYLKHGRYGESEASLERAAELAPDSLSIRTQLALSRLSAGNHEQAITELKAIQAEDPSFQQADIMLALVHLSAGDHEAAQGAARALVEKDAENALPFNVLGYTLEVSGDREQAREYYEKAVSVDEAFHPARINLARLAVQDKDIEAGRRHFQGVLDREANHQFALLGLAALALQEDNLDEAERLWTVARDNNPDAVAPRLLLAKHYRVRNNQVLAENAIKEAYALAPFALQVQREYAEIMMLGGHFEEALKAAENLSERLPNSLIGLETLARVYNRLGDEEGLRTTLERVAEIAPDAVGARVLLGQLAIRRKEFDEATRIGNTLLSSEEHVQRGHELLGDVHVAQQDFEAAHEAFLKAHEANPTTINLLKLDEIERLLGQATDRLDKWLEAHPDDLRARFARASRLQSEGTGAAAIPEYENMLREQGANPVLLNNLAWLYHETGDERAVELAKQAHEMAPKQPEIMDTYGWILMSSGKQAQGRELLEKAASLAPDNADIAYHVIAARYRDGREAEARGQLEALLETHAKFPSRADAERLLAEMSE